MKTEIVLEFPSAESVLVQAGDLVVRLPFRVPLGREVIRQLSWYADKYTTEWATDLDDRRASRIEALLPIWASSLSGSVFTHPDAARVLKHARSGSPAEFLITIRTDAGEVQALPWELLRIALPSPLPSGARIGIRRAPLSLSPTVAPPARETASGLHVLIVVCRPVGAGFFDPRRAAAALLDAVEGLGPSQATVEFLRPPTPEHLAERFRDASAPSVDVLFFDGHGTLGPGEPVRESAQAPGYLVFEDGRCRVALVSAATLSSMMEPSPPRLIIMTACQSASVDASRATVSLAAELTRKGTTSVVAMSYVVLVATARRFVARLFSVLARGGTLGDAVEAARDELVSTPTQAPHQRRYGLGPHSMRDWFVPVLYEAGPDHSLISEPAPAVSPSPLSPTPSGNAAGGGQLFVGRAQQLRGIETYMAQGIGAVALTGLRGVGKTACALEAARWLQRTQMIDGFALLNCAEVNPDDLVVAMRARLPGCQSPGFSGLDSSPGGPAGPSRFVLILDDVDRVAAAVRESLLAELGCFVAGGGVAVILTAADDAVGMDALNFLQIGQRRLVRIRGGLAPDEALEYLALRLAEVPRAQRDVERSDALRLFRQVGFMPGAVVALATQLRSRTVLELEAEIGDDPAGAKHDPASRAILAAIGPVLDVGPAWLPALGVLRDGATEQQAARIMDVPLQEVEAAVDHLVHAGLAQREGQTPLGPFVRLHPLLASDLLRRISATDLDDLVRRCREGYADLARLLYDRHDQDPEGVRAVALAEMQNLQRAGFASLEAGDSWAFSFVETLGLLLRAFGFRGTWGRLSAEAQRRAGTAGSLSWYLATKNRAWWLYEEGDQAGSLGLFLDLEQGAALLDGHCLCEVLSGKKRCLLALGQPAEALLAVEKAIGITDSAAADDPDWLRMRAVLRIERGDVLRDLDQPVRARAAYVEAAEYLARLGANAPMNVVLAQLGALAVSQGRLGEARQWYEKAAEAEEASGNVRNQALALQNLGAVLAMSGKLDDSERVLRRAGELLERTGLNAGRVYGEIGLTLMLAGRLVEAEPWLRRAVGLFEGGGDRVALFRTLGNLAALLLAQPGDGPLAEASSIIRRAIEMAEAQQLDESAETFALYEMMAEVHKRRGEKERSTSCRVLARRLLMDSAGMFRRAAPHWPFIQSVAATVVDATHMPKLDAVLRLLEVRGAVPIGGPLARVARRVVAGERDSLALVMDLDLVDASIVGVILHLLRRARRQKTDGP